MKLGRLLFFIGISIGFSEVSATTDCTQVTEIPKIECEALIALYNSTSGPSWINHAGWNTNNTPCSWYGISCDNGYVVSIDLRSNQLSGTIPPELGNFSNLGWLALYSNQLSGPIPLELGNLINLGGLELGDNHLSGSIPQKLGNLINLQAFDLSENQLIGPIPSEFGNLINLQDLELYSNQLSGPIPLALGNLSHLEGLWLYHNQLSGPIPLALGNLSHLRYLNLYSNQLIGLIPSTLGNLSNLVAFGLSSNQLCGDIPLSLMNLTNLQLSDMQLENNALNIDNLDPALKAFLDSHNATWQPQNPAPAVCSSLPMANNLNISLTPTGTPTFTIGETLQGNYTYSDTENDPEGTSTFQWYTATDATCTTEKTAILGATNQTYTLTSSEVGKYLCFEVTPVAASGASPGTAVLTTSSDIVIASPLLTQPPPSTTSPPAEPLPPTMNLTLNFGGNGQGHVTTAPHGIDCDSSQTQCSHSYETASWVSLIAIPAAGSKFTGFGGYQSDCENGELFMSGPHSCTAHFELETNPTATLTVSQSGTGKGTITSLPAGIDCGDNCQTNFNTATPVTLTATAAADSQFAGFNGDEDCGDGNLILNGDKICTARFELLPITTSLTLPANLEFSMKTTGEGSVTIKTTFANGDPALVLTAQPAAGFKFIGFSGSSACTTGHLVLNASTKCEATFIRILSGTAGFSASHYETSAGEKTLTVIVKRSEGTEGNLTVNYVTQDDTAKAGWDYLAAQGSLTWAEGENDDKTITIPLLDAPTITDAEVFNSKKVFIIQLTAANNKTLDTAQLSLLAEHPIPSVSPELTTPEPTVAMPEEVVGDIPLCAATGWLNLVCNAQWRTVTDLKVGTEGNLSTAVLKGTIDNQGWVSNLIIKPQSQVKGGIVTGYIYNQGTLSNFEFRGYSIVGGTLAGDIFNTSDVSGFFQDVQLAPHTQIHGGILQGRIIGDPIAPVWLDNLKVRKGSYLANVTFGNHVTLEEDVTLEGMVPLPKLGEAVATDAQGHEIHHLTTQFLGGIAMNSDKFQQQVQQPRVATAEIRGRIIVDSSHSGQVAEILVYVTYQPLADSSQVSYFMLDTQGKVLPWDKNLTNLVAFQREVTLNTWQEVPIYQGLFPATGVINLYFAYRLPDGTVVISGESMAVTVTE